MGNRNAAQNTTARDRLLSSLYVSHYRPISHYFSVNLPIYRKNRVGEGLSALHCLHSIPFPKGEEILIALIACPVENVKRILVFSGP